MPQGVQPAVHAKAGIVILCVWIVRVLHVFSMDGYGTAYGRDIIIIREDRPAIAITT